MDSSGKNPAYPAPAGTGFPGVSRRQWYAALAMQGFVTKGIEVRSDRVFTEEDKEIILATRAFRMADAMLKVEAQSNLEAR